MKFLQIIHWSIYINSLIQTKPERTKTFQLVLKKYSNSWRTNLEKDIGNVFCCYVFKQFLLKTMGRKLSKERLELQGYSYVV